MASGKDAAPALIFGTTVARALIACVLMSTDPERSIVALVPDRFMLSLVRIPSAMSMSPVRESNVKLVCERSKKSSEICLISD